MIALLSLLSLVTTASDDVHYTDCSVRLEAEFLDARFLNVDADPALELVLALRRPNGDRELRIHELDARGALEPEPRRIVPILADVLAWTFCDLRAEPGAELVFLTPKGAHTMSLSKKGLRGNLKRFAKVELIFHIPDTHRLEYWPWFIDQPGTDQLLLPTMQGMTLFTGPGEDGSPSFKRFGQEATLKGDDEEDNELEISSGSVQFQFGEAAAEGYLLAESDLPGPVFLSSYTDYDAPGMADIDGDGIRDLLVLEKEELLIYASTSQKAEPRREKLPDYLTNPDRQIELSFHDIDGDGDADLLGQTQSGEESDFGNDDLDILVLINDGGRLLPSKPSQVMRFSAAHVKLHIEDINADGQPDLFTESVSLPSMTALVTGLHFSMISELHLGQGQRGFERKPTLKEERVFDEDSLVDAIAIQQLTFDCSGDGICDSVAVDTSGRVTIRRLLLESSFFSGDQWSFEETPWKRFESRGSLLSLEVADWNGDGIGDILSYGEERLALYLSRRSR